MFAGPVSWSREGFSLLHLAEARFICVLEHTPFPEPCLLCVPASLGSSPGPPLSVMEDSTGRIFSFVVLFLTQRFVTELSIYCKLVRMSSMARGRKQTEMYYVGSGFYCCIR